MTRNDTQMAGERFCGLVLRDFRRIEALADVLGARLAVQRADPFVSDTVCVPDAGLQRWLAQRWSTSFGAVGQGDGVCAGIEFVSPGRLRRLVTELTLDEVDETDAWAPASLAWRVLEACDDETVEGLELIRGHIGAPGDPLRPGRRYRTARRVARLFRRYCAERPDLVDAWSAGHDVDADAGPLPPDATWQPVLWRAVRDRLSGPDPAARQRLSLDASAVRARFPRGVDLVAPPRRSTSWWRLVHELSTHVRVEVWHVGAVVGQGLSSRLGTAGLAHHDQVASLATAHEPPSDDPPPGVSLVQRLQRDALGGDRAGATTLDDSVQVHASHGADRQVEVLREVLTGLFSDDPTLEPREVLVLCPDPARFAPLIESAFGQTPHGSTTHPGHQLRVQVTGALARRPCPVLEVLDHVLSLAYGRAELATLLDLLAAPPVAHRFGFGEDDLETIETLLTQANVRWGVDAALRADAGLQAYGQNTWAAGLDRLVAGVAMNGASLTALSTALPLDQVQSSDVSLVGTLLEVVGRVREIVVEARGTHTVQSWVDLCRRALDLLVAVPSGEAWQATQSLSVLADIEATATGTDVTIGAGDLRALLTDAWAAGRGRPRFGTGALLVCPLGSVVHVPHRVVVLVGLDDGIFPRAVSVDGDDLLARRCETHGIDARADDRQLLLDALLAARERFVVVHQGASPHTNEPVPDSVALSEIYDQIDALVGVSGAARTHLRTAHALQPFTPAAFTIAPGSFDQTALRGARATTAPRVDPVPAFALGSLPEPPPEPVTLDQLAGFLIHPVRSLVRHRGGLYLGERDRPDDAIPLLANPLTAWAPGQHILDALLQGHDVDDAVAAEALSGALPPRELGRHLLDGAARNASAIAEAVVDERGTQHDHAIDLVVGGQPLTGRVRTHDGVVHHVFYSRVAAKHLLGVWPGLLTLAVARPDQRWRAVLVGKRSRSTLIAPPSSIAITILTDLLDLYRQGLTRPLPMPPRASQAWVTASDDERDKAVDVWWAREHDDTWGRFYGKKASSLFAQPTEPSWALGTDQPHLFGQLAVRVWGYLRTAEVTP